MAGNSSDHQDIMRDLQVSDTQLEEYVVAYCPSMYIREQSPMKDKGRDMCTHESQARSAKI